MLFNSYEFIFVFLPVVLAVYFFLARYSRRFSLGWIVLASVAFYAWWRPVNVLIIGFSLIVNYSIATSLMKSTLAPANSRIRKWLLTAGIIFNVCYLGYFKYINFAREALADITGTDFVLTQVVLPLGISFITFQKIAFLIDVHSGRIERFKFREFLLFIMFFPQLIAGPIVHFREMIPQFKSQNLAFDAGRISTGLTLFIFGLFKKVVLADGVSEYVTPIYEFAANGGVVTLFQGWMASLGFTLQIYFDFSGYSDMAAGLAVCFGVRLPLNFDSPLRAKNIIDFWSRWHITLTRFLTSYVYNPLALHWTRKRISRGLPNFGMQNAGLGAFIQILAVPTVLTMTLSGLWHGAGYLFILWGLLHGVYIALNHGWRIFKSKSKSGGNSESRVGRPLAFLTTFLSVAVAMVLFRSVSMDGASQILLGMAGANGIGLPVRIFEMLPSISILSATPEIAPLSAATDFVIAYGWLAALLVIALIAPNTAEIMYLYQPFIEKKSLATKRWQELMTWRPNWQWVIFVSILGATAVIRMGGRSEFLYWQF